MVEHGGLLHAESCLGESLCISGCGAVIILMVIGICGHNQQTGVFPPVFLKIADKIVVTAKVSGSGFGYRPVFHE